MPKISSYSTTAPALTDKLIGTDANDNSATKNFTVGDVIGLVVGPIGFTQDLTAASLYNQQPPSLNTLKQITFGVSGVDGTNTSLSGSGDLTFNTAGVYYIDYAVNKGLVTATNPSGMLQISFGVFKNGTQIMRTIKDTQYYPANEGIGGGESINMSFMFEASASDVLTFKMITNSSNMGLTSQSQVQLDQVPSANITVFRTLTTS